MDTKVTGTEDQKSSPGEKEPSGNKFEKAAEALKQMARGETSVESEREEKVDPDLSENDGTQEQDKSSKNDWSKRYNHLQAYADKHADMAEKMALSMLEKDPDAIHKIAEMNSDLADKIVAKELKKSHGIETYEQFKEALEQQDGEEPTEKKSKDNEIDKRLKALETEKEQEDQAKAERFIEKFRSKNPDFKGDIEEKTWELFNNSQLTLEQAYKFVKYESGQSEKESELEEKAYAKLASKKAASAFGSSSAKSVSVKTKAVNNATKDFLDIIGAKKTLAKYN